MATVNDSNGRAEIREAILAWLRRAAEKGEMGGRFDHPTPIALAHRERRTKQLIDADFASVLWDLVAEGMIVPGMASYLRTPSGEQQKTWPWFTFTAYGFDAMSGKAETTSPHDAARFLTDARARLPEGDELIALYLEEANRAFISRLYPSSVVMLGISAEALMEWLTKSVRRHLHPADCSRFDKLLNKDAHRTGERFAKLITEIKRHKDEMSRDLFEVMESHLENVIVLLKSYRDDVAHLRPFRVDAQLADAQLRLYLPTLSVAAELAHAISQPCTLPV